MDVDENGSADRGAGSGADSPAPAPVRRRWRRLRALLIALAVGLVGLAIFVAIIWVLTPIPSTTQKLATAQGSVIYYRDGTTVLATEGVNRANVPLSQVPTAVRDAVIAAENRTFYQDQGVSLSGTARAVWSTITGRQVQGGSTITQQLVRNYYSGLGQERSVARKLKEIMIALKVDRSQSKNWILERYLNTIYFGRGAYGVQAASRAYFGKDVQHLTVAEGAYLAAVIQQPSRFADPQGAALEAVRHRWQSVIDGMVESGALTPLEAGLQTFPALAKQKRPLSPGGQTGYMLDQVRAELGRLGYTDEDISRGGLRVTTTFDRRLVRLAVDAVRTVLPDDTPKQVRTGLAAVDPATGEVLAFYGGRYESNQYDNAFSARVPAGSTFKPYVLAAALEAGYGLDALVNGNSPLRIDSAQIPNSSGRSYGPAITLVDATRFSVNTAFVDLGQRVGLDKVAAAAEAAGIPAGQLAGQAPYPTFPLGTASVSAIQQAAGFAAFAAGGLHHDPHVIRSVTDARGVTRTIAVLGKRAFNARTAADTTFALQQAVEAGTGSVARLYDRPVAGKTGTASRSAAAWFVGYVPQLAVAVNMFRDDNEPVTVPGYGELYGGTLPAEIWRHFMSNAMEGQPVEEFPPPVSWDPNRPLSDPTASPSPDRTPTGSPNPDDTLSPSRAGEEGSPSLGPHDETPGFGPDQDSPGFGPDNGRPAREPRPDPASEPTSASNGANDGGGGPPDADLDHDDWDHDDVDHVGAGRPGVAPSDGARPI